MGKNGTKKWLANTKALNRSIATAKIKARKIQRSIAILRKVKTKEKAKIKRLTKMRRRA